MAMTMKMRMTDDGNNKKVGQWQRQQGWLTRMDEDEDNDHEEDGWYVEGGIDKKRFN